jgi:hypothetical protein
MSDDRVYELKINQSVPLKRWWLSKMHVLYAGMPNETTYSLVMTYTSSHNSIAYNLFIPKSQKEIDLIKGRLVVLRVNADSISFRHERGDFYTGKTPI